MDATHLKSSKIVIIDDHEANVYLLERVLRQDRFEHLTTLCDPLEALPAIHRVQPDLIMLDLHMPGMDGFAILERLAEDFPGDRAIPIIVLTADTTPQTRWRALRLGAKDFLTKPFDTIEVALRVCNLLETRWLQQRLFEHNRLLEEQVQARTRDLEQARLEVLVRLARTGEYRDDDTGLHAQRVGRLAQQIASQLGLSSEEIATIEQAAPLHDLGKVGIPDQILLKPGGLTAQEFATVKHHTSIGAAILANSHFPVLQAAEEIALSHHERWDGSGYPNGLRGDAIPLRGRIVAVADAFDVITHARPYKAALPVEVAIEELQRQAGRQFDPQIVDACIAVVNNQGPAETAR